MNGPSSPVDTASERRIPPLLMAVNWVAVIVPLMGIALAIVFLWNSWVTWKDLALLVGLYLITCLGIGVGYHRLLTHRSFKTFKGLRYMWAIFGSLALEGPPVSWVGSHRCHHDHADEA